MGCLLSLRTLPVFLACVVQLVAADGEGEEDCLFSYVSGQTVSAVVGGGKTNNPIPLRFRERLNQSGKESWGFVPLSKHPQPSAMPLTI